MTDEEHKPGPTSHLPQPFEDLDAILVRATRVLHTQNDLDALHLARVATDFVCLVKEHRALLSAHDSIIERSNEQLVEIQALRRSHVTSEQMLDIVRKLNQWSLDDFRRARILAEAHLDTSAEPSTDPFKEPQ